MTVKSDFFNPNMGAAASSGVAAAASAASADELRTALSAMPKGTREALRAALADHDASAPPGLAIAEKAAIAQPACCQPGPATPEASYPLYAMPMATFMSLERLPPHNELREKGLVKALDFGGEHRNAALNFISHQWLGFSEADPQSVHLKTMQRVFNCAASGEKIFRSEEDWNAYSKGYTAENAARQVEAMAAGSGASSSASSCCWTPAPTGKRCPRRALLTPRPFGEVIRSKRALTGPGGRGPHARSTTRGRRPRS